MVAAAINAALKAQGVRCPSRLVGEDASAWSSHVHGRRVPRWSTVEGWLATAWRQSWWIDLALTPEGLIVTATLVRR